MKHTPRQYTVADGGLAALLTFDQSEQLFPFVVCHDVENTVPDPHLPRSVSSETDGDGLGHMRFGFHELRAAPGGHGGMVRRAEGREEGV